MSPASDDDRVIFEFYPIGSYVKVSAIDPRTMVEVSIVGDPARGETALRHAAMQKLRYVLEKRAKGGRGGLIV
ncbi:DUF6898 family protein [Oceanibaculum pacificum]|uniref:DUF6898 domain-containing protein n=1 Tax=Oceanibaculum pacificum TaxID=580166 RepID=A0A154W8K0_9PROT|nr:hypothetical protein [Oceanibaculum pacificum]KZD09847.1 hypothetical protein AUP43_01320 [Oceanibaculum pacificum]